MPNNFNLSPSMPVWNERVSASPNGLLDQIRRRRAEYGAAPYKDKPDGLISLSKAPPSLDIPKMYQDPNAAKYGFVNNSQAAQYKPGLVQPSANAGLINGMTPQNIKEREAYQQQMAAGERSMFEPPNGGLRDSGPDAVDTLLPLIAGLEGATRGRDIRGIQTEALGLVNDPINQPTTTRNNNAVAMEMFDRPLNQLTLEEKGDVVYAIFQDLDAKLEDYEDPITKEKTYNYLSPKYKALVLDAKFNTGTTYKKLMKAALRHQNNPSAENLAAMTQESRRKVKENGVKVNHFGLDNRVRNLFHGVGLEADPGQLISRNPGSDVNVQPTATPANWYEASQLSDYQFQSGNLGIGNNTQ